MRASSLPTAAWLCALALTGCLDPEPGPRTPPAGQPPDRGSDARPDVGPDGAPTDAAPDADGADTAPGPDDCAPLADPDPVPAPGISARAPCAAGDAVRVDAPPGRAIRARLTPRGGALIAELWWPGAIRVERLAVDGDATLSWTAPAEGTVLRVFGPGQYGLTIAVEAPPTAPIRVQGRVAGWARPVTDMGLGGPAGFTTAGARVDLVDEAGAWVAAGRVDGDGRFDLRAEAAPAPMTLRLVAEAEALGVPVRVGPDGRLPWAEPVASLDGSADVDAGLDPDGPTAAAWFVARTAADALARLGPLLPPDLPAADTPPARYRWRPGFAEPCGSCFRPGAEPLIELSGRLSDPDEWDRAVIVHEMGHHVAAAFSRDDSGGGRHDGSRIEPAIAWSEGFATFFGGWPDTPVQLDYKLAGVARLDLEAMADPMAFGTADGTGSGAISEWLVAALLWDLHDGPPGDDDPAQLEPGAVFGPLFGALRAGWTDRGAPGIDLVDYLDALWCLEPPEAAAQVVAARAVPHDPRCRMKGAGPLSARPLPDGRVEITVGSDGILSRSGDDVGVPVRAGARVEWAGGPAGAVLRFDGGRAVLPLKTPTSAPIRLRRRAGAWEVLSATRRP